MAEERVITKEDFHLLLKWLGSYDESATDKYEKIRDRLIRIFVARGCFEAELLADRTIDRVTVRVEELSRTYVGKPELFFYGVGKNIYFEWLRQQKRDSDAYRRFDVNLDDRDRELEYVCLTRCVEKLTGEDRQIVVNYYAAAKSLPSAETRRLQAKKLGIPIAALHVKVSRIRQKLAKCVQKCSSEK